MPNLKAVPAPEVPLSPSGLDHFDGLLDKLSDALGDLLDLSGVHHNDINADSSGVWFVGWNPSRWDALPSEAAPKVGAARKTLRELHDHATNAARHGDHQTFGGTIGELIAEGERLTPDGPVISAMNIQEWVNQLVFLTGALPDEDRQWWTVATAEAPALDAGWTIRNEREVIAFRLPFLYALRRRLDRPAEVVDDKAT